MKLFDENYEKEMQKKEIESNLKQLEMLMKRVSELVKADAFTEENKNEAVEFFNQKVSQVVTRRNLFAKQSNNG